MGSGRSFGGPGSAPLCVDAAGHLQFRSKALQANGKVSVLVLYTDNKRPLSQGTLKNTFPHFKRVPGAVTSHS